MAVPYKLVKSNGNVPHGARMLVVLNLYSTVGIELWG